MTLVISKTVLAALSVNPEDYGGRDAPKFGITCFGDAYRLGRDLIANYVQARGAHPIATLKSKGYDVTIANEYN